MMVTLFCRGRFDDFFDNAASTIEFKGDNEANLPLKPGNI